MFLDPHRVEMDATRLADHENRRRAVGVVEGKLFTVVFTNRGNAIRIISVRRSSRGEERDYGDRSIYP